MDMARSRVTVGQRVLLKGKSRHGKNRIQQHGSMWTVTRLGQFNGHDAFQCESEHATFSIGTQGRKIKDCRWVFTKDAPNFLFFH